MCWGARPPLRATPHVLHIIVRSPQMSILKERIKELQTLIPDSIARQLKRIEGTVSLMRKNLNIFMTSDMKKMLHMPDRLKVEHQLKSL